MEGESNNIPQPPAHLFFNAKCSLMEEKHSRGSNLYEHLLKLVRTILKTSVDKDLGGFEEISRYLKEYHISASNDTIKDIDPVSTSFELAKRLMKHHKGVRKTNNNQIGSSQDLQKILSIFEYAGIGLTSDEAFYIQLSIARLIENKKLNNCRFWGKVYGRSKNYYVVECDHDKQGYPERKEIKPAQNEDTQGVQDLNEDTASENLERLDLHTPRKQDLAMPVEIPAEEPGKGTNAKMYFVCASYGDEWIRLPDVTPDQISASRLVKHLCTGHLSAEVDVYPEFPGVEQNYLRAQIARISGSTGISPINYYQFDEGDEEEDENFDEEGQRENVIANPEFEPLSIFDLVEPTLTSWVHCTAYILPQGRTQWWNPVPAKDWADNESNDSEDDQSDEAMEETEPEAGPPLLTPLSEDADVDGLPPWSAQITSQLVPHYAYSVLSSTRWFGAATVAANRFFENIYIGWGQKYHGGNLSSLVIPPTLTEFPSGPETAEQEDPTPEEEAAWREAQAETARRAAERAKEDEDEAEEDEEEEEEGGSDSDQ